MRFASILVPWRFFLFTVPSFMVSSPSSFLAFAQVVECQADEALLEIEATTGSTPDYDWHVIDDRTGQIIHQCRDDNETSTTNSTEINNTCYWESNQDYIDRVCLPRDGCYTLVVGRRYLAEFIADTNVVNVTFDQTEWASFKNMQYETVFLNLGSECEISFCDSDSHFFELFLFRHEVYQEQVPNMTWSLSTVASDQSDDVILDSNVISFGDRAFHYHRACVSKANPCVRFNVSVPSTFDVVTSSESSTVEAALATEQIVYNENATCRLIIDGTIFNGEQVLEFGEIEQDYAVFEHSQTIGNCSTIQACHYDGMSLLSLDLLTGAQSPTQQQFSDVSFKISTFFEDSSYVWVEYDGSDVYPLETYRYLVCFQNEFTDESKESCTEFNMNSDWADNGIDAAYVVSVDGVIFSDQKACGRDDCLGRMITPLRGQCDATWYSATSSAPSSATHFGRDAGYVVTVVALVIGVLV